MEAQPAQPKTDSYIFNFNWETVIKGFWNKYPHKDLDFVVYSRVIDMKRLEDDSILVKKVMYVKKFSLLWAYTMEEMKIDFNEKVLDLKTQVLAASRCLPTDTVENIRYKAIHNEPGQTLYTKFLESKGAIQKYYGKLNSGFEKGCKIVEEKCNEVLTNAKLMADAKLNAEKSQ